MSHQPRRYSAALSEQGVNASFEWRPSNRWTLQLAAGALLSGLVVVAGTEHLVLPGVSGTLSGAFRAVDEQKVVPFVLLSASISASSTSTVEKVAGATPVALTSAEFRLGIAVGKTFADTVTPYLTARVFGGPVFWRFADTDLVGGDRYHYQLGAGVSVRISPAWDLYAEGVPLGERRVSAGVGLSF